MAGKGTETAAHLSVREIREGLGGTGARVFDTGQVSQNFSDYVRELKANCGRCLK
jgi:hypothetical protein